MFPSRRRLTASRFTQTVPLSCVLHRTAFYQKLVVKAVGPVLVLALLWLKPLVDGKPASSQLASKLSLLWLELIYTSVSTTIFETFACDEFDGERFYLRVELTLACDGSSVRQGWLIYATFMLLVYSLGALIPPCCDRNQCIKEALFPRSRRHTVAFLCADLLQSGSSEAAVTRGARDRHATCRPSSPWFNHHRPSCSQAIPLRSPAIKSCRLRHRVGSPEMAGQKDRTICAFLLAVSIASALTAAGSNLAYGYGRTTTRPMLARKYGCTCRCMRSQRDGTVSQTAGEERKFVSSTRNYTNDRLDPPLLIAG